MRRLQDRINLEKDTANNIFNKTLAKADEIIWQKIKNNDVQQHLVDESIRQIEDAAAGASFQRSRRVSDLYEQAFNEAQKLFLILGDQQRRALDRKLNEAKEALGGLCRNREMLRPLFFTA